jgi:hypothetical protein
VNAVAPGLVRTVLGKQVTALHPDAEATILAIDGGLTAG